MLKIVDGIDGAVKLSLRLQFTADFVLFMDAIKTISYARIHIKSCERYRLVIS